MADVGTGRRQRWPWRFLMFVLVLASACGPTEDLPSPSRSPAPSAAGDLQLRPVIEIVSRSSVGWEETELTCAPGDAAFEDCVAGTLDAPRVVLLGSGEAPERYVLGPRIVDGSDVERAIAQRDSRPSAGWIVYADLTGEGTAAFATATEAAVGSQIAIVINGMVVSSPTVAAPITSGDVVLASGLTERAAISLVSMIDPDRG